MTDEMGEKLVKAIDGVYFALQEIADELRTLNERRGPDGENPEQEGVDWDLVDALTAAHADTDQSTDDP